MALSNLTGLRSVRNALLCSALAVPAVTPIAAVAQDQSEACAQLEQAAERIDFQDSEISEEEFARVVESGDAEECETWLTQIDAEAGGEVVETERARVRLQDEVVIEGSVTVDQEQPRVQIEEQAPEITVGSATPDVNVTSAPMDILIRQSAPRISLEMPQPTITIEQPAPEIIVTMPDPSVDVSNTRPQIEVRQGEPRVQVTMAEPTVELDLRQAEDPENSPGIEVRQRQAEAGSDGASPEPEVTFSRGEAKVIFQEDEQQQANVNVSRSEPNIRFEQAEPEIDMATSGEPTVNWNQTGEVTVTFQENTDGHQNEQADQDANALTGEDADTETAAVTESQNDQDVQAQDAQDPNAQAQSGGPAVRREGYVGVAVGQIEASELEVATVYGVQGEEIGEIGQLRLGGEEAQSVIVDIGGFLGMGERHVEIPFSDLTILQGEDDGDLRVYVDASEERLNSYPEAE